MDPIEPNTTRPALKPEPVWMPHAGGKYYRTDGPSLHSLPAAHALGFEEGAYALADKLNELVEANNLPELVAHLYSYRNRNARPALGWHNEPPRS